jgi:uncharacterized protein YjbI with pentapeptide repeats
LSDQKLEVRSGAIYTLQQIASDFPDLATPVYKLLEAYLGGKQVRFRRLGTSNRHSGNNTHGDNMAQSQSIKPNHPSPDHLPPLDIHGAFVRRTDLSGASPRKANLAGADATNARFRGADFEDANLKRPILIGADLTGPINLTVDQLKSAAVDATTILPSSIQREEPDG